MFVPSPVSFASASTASPLPPPPLPYLRYCLSPLLVLPKAERERADPTRPTPPKMRYIIDQARIPGNPAQK